MRIFQALRSMAAAGALISASVFTAGAGSISTPIIYLGDGNQLVCIANNVSSITVKVTVTIVGVTQSSSQTCTLHSGDRVGCPVFRNNDSGHCIIEVAALSDSQVFSDLRGVLFSRQTVSPFNVETAVDAR